MPRRQFFLIALASVIPALAGFALGIWLLGGVAFVFVVLFGLLFAAVALIGGSYGFRAGKRATAGLSKRPSNSEARDERPGRRGTGD